MKSTILTALGAIALAVLLIPSLSFAQTEPINIALFNPIQIFPENTSVGGLSINLIYGKNASVDGLDWGLVNVVGNGGATGLQWGVANIAGGKVLGMQGGFINVSSQSMEGFQYGWVNSADHMSGFQLGLVNFAQTMNGLQIGILNFIKTGGQFPVFPIVNWSF